MIELILLFQSIFAQQVNFFEHYTYQGIPSSPCTLLLSTNGSIGCQSTTQSLGQLQLVSDAAALSSALSSDANIVLVMSPTLFASNFDKISTAPKLAGVLLSSTVYGFSTPSSYSPASKCPNCAYGLYRNDNPYNWNPNVLKVLLRAMDWQIKD
jgi:Nicastrin small lobe